VAVTWKQLLIRYAQSLLDALEKHDLRTICGCSSAQCALLLANLPGKAFLAVESTQERAARLHADVVFLQSLLHHETNKADTLLLPAADSVDAIGSRATIFERLMFGERIGVIASHAACVTGFREQDAPFGIELVQGAEMQRSHLIRELNRLGYRQAEIVVEPGEYAERNWVIDLYPASEPRPVRIEFFGDEIELMRRFEVETQLSAESVQHLVIKPAVEPEAENSIFHLVEKTSDIPVFAATGLEIAEGIRAYRFTQLLVDDGSLPFGHISFSELGIMPQNRTNYRDIGRRLSSIDKRILIVIASRGQAERLRDLLAESDFVVPILDRLDAADYDGKACITIGDLSGGFHLPELVVLTGSELFGEKPGYRPIRKSRASRLLLTIDDLKPGDLIVHKDHGIGRFISLEHRQTGEYAEDLLVLEYAQGDRVYLPLSGIGRLQKYRAAENAHPALDRLGRKRWANAQKRVKQSLVDIADKLIKLYAERSIARGFVFSADTPLHQEFDDFFPYEETEDQIRAVELIKKQMQSDRPMDLLLCGDVGYGKTEVAIKAAFRAVYDHKQVAVLVPTTLLAEQHYRTFVQRFSGFPVTIDYICRFRSKSDIQNCLNGLADGRVDIVIGTHMLLGKRITFRDLGLLIIDEEHRFGVGQKERLKELRKSVDVLSMTATPIPRTLHMAIAGVRELATIQTPPEERLAVRSIVTTWKDSTIQEAIRRELRRDGQVFFLHNRIADMPQVVSRLNQLVPEARIAVAHGQMSEHMLERIMIDFLDRKTDVLVCTAIIGAGIDIASANTIIIDRADAFGLADLYQIRGRVGRGSVQAYAYFLIPGEDILQHDAKLRLQAIQEMSYLGAGFRLAMKDLEIRGAGNLLGAEQSGHIGRIGFDLYTELLEKAVHEVKGEYVPPDIEPQIQLQISAFISEHYVADTMLRLSLYRRIADLASRDDADRLENEIRDRFGPLPAETQNLLIIARIKILARRLRLSRLILSAGNCRCITISAEDASALGDDHFYERLLQVLCVLQSDKSVPRIRLLPEGFEFVVKSGSDAERMARIEKFLSLLVQRIPDQKTAQTDKSVSSKI
jgi:transcription-repair coupling factor (superfamily II helicase)